jgi:hypothetical protein
MIYVDVRPKFRIVPDASKLSLSGKASTRHFIFAGSELAELAFEEGKVEISFDANLVHAEIAKLASRHVLTIELASGVSEAFQTTVQVSLPEIENSNQNVSVWGN